jgi:alanyl-tRNA synthetase
VWELYSSYGYPLDLVRIMCEERNLTVDEAGLEQVAHDFRKASRKLETGASGTRLDQFAISHLKNLGISATNDEHKYSFYKNSFGAYVFPAVNSVIKAIRLDNQFVKEAVEGSTNVMIILSDTNFYAERGGQIYDTGLISLGDEAIFKVERVVNDSGYVSHVGTVEFGRFAVGNTVLLNVNEVSLLVLS